MKLLHEEHHAVPLVDFTVLVTQGAVSDPVEKSGLTRMMARVMRMGPKGMSATKLEDELALMGARFGASVSPGSVRFSGVVLARHFDSFVALLGRCILDPAFRPADISKAKRETLSSLQSWLDDDRDLAARGFSKMVFDGHPYRNSLAGTPSSLKKIRKEDLVAQHRKLFRSKNIIIGAAGSVTGSNLRKTVKTHLSFPNRKPTAVSFRDPKMKKGRHITIVHKEHRTQTQMFIGTLGSKAKDPMGYALTVADNAFGGSFSGRLMNEVRSKRGLSYGASSSFSTPKYRGSWRMWTHPSVEHVVDCAALQLRLFDTWVDKGLSASEVNFAKRSLINGRCFDVDTPSLRLSIRMGLAMHSLKQSLMEEYVDRIKGVSRKDANEAVQARLSRRDVAISVVADASLIEAGLAKLPGIDSVQVIPFQEL